MSRRLFEEVAQSSAYALFRPRPPLELIEYVTQFIREKAVLSTTGRLARAIDVGSGSGQATSLLSPYFDEVLGYDVSQSQIDQAIVSNKCSNVHYGIAPAEHLPHESNSVDLIFCAQAFHWLDANEFFTEANRVLKTNGVLAISVYEMPTTFPPGENEAGARPDVINLVRNTYRSPILKKYWAAKERDMVDTAYRDVSLPFPEFHRKDEFFQKFEASAQDIVGYVNSWSGFNEMRKSEPDNEVVFLEKFQRDVFDITGLGLKESKLDVKFDFHLLLARKS
jgi:SAM-dependent methyltransferase